MKIENTSNINLGANAPNKVRSSQPFELPEDVQKQRVGGDEQRQATPHTNKLEIPQDYEPVQGLTTKEQTFFEQLFPKSRREIRSYLNQQQKNFPAKGQLIDVKG